MPITVKGVTAARAESLDSSWRHTTVGLHKRPWARSYSVSVWTPSKPPEELVAITVALSRELRKGVAPRACAGWLALRDWLEANAGPLALREFNEIDERYGARTFKQALSASGLSRPRRRRRPRPQ